MTPLERPFNKIVDSVVRTVHPKQIVLFGSWARGVARPDSDIDLLIIEDAPFGPQRSRRKELGNVSRALMDLKLPIDVLIYTTAEIDQWKGTKNHVIAHAMREGRVLYDRP